MNNRSLLLPACVLLFVNPSSRALGMNQEGEMSSAKVVTSAEEPVLRPFTFEGFVLDTAGVPAKGAVIVSSAGGKVVAGMDGSYRLELLLPLEAESVQLTAIGSGSPGPLASTSVSVSASSGVARVDTLALRQDDACQQSWLPTFGARIGVAGPVVALASYDAGSGPELYVGGGFTIEGTPTGVLKWDGTRWSSQGAGVAGVRALLVHDDGSGPALFAGGDFGTGGGIARWDGTNWSALGSGLVGNGFFGSSVRAMALHDDGGGPALYVGGFFMTAGGVPVNHVAKWDGTSWSALGSGLGGFGNSLSPVHTLSVYDDGSGPALFVGGEFTSAGGSSANRVAKWDGASWSPLGTGTNQAVHALTVYDDGGGPALYAGGRFNRANGVPARGVAKWDGSNWSGLGAGVGLLEEGVNALAVHDDGSGSVLIVGGSITMAGGNAVNRIAKWSGTSWSTLGSGVDGTVVTLATLAQDGTQTLFVGGEFSTASGVWVSNLAKWDGASWSAVGSGALSGTVSALAEYDDGHGTALYAGGFFLSGASFQTLMRWTGQGWSALGSGVDGAVRALAVYDDGSGPALHAAGSLVAAGGVPAIRIAKWDGTGWSALASGIGSSSNSPVNAMTVYDDGSGPALYVGGDFTTAGGVPASHIAKWDGARWSALGSGTNAPVFALTVYDDGSGEKLCLGGAFTTAGGVAANQIAAWDGAVWSTLGSGMTASVRALVEHDDGSGRALYAGGEFDRAGGTRVNQIAKWDGASWSALGNGVGSFVHSLSAYDDGGGPALYVGGSFSRASGLAVNHIAKWDGAGWSALGSGTSSIVRALVVHDGGGGPALHAGGDFLGALDSGDSYLARWGAIDTTPPSLSCPPYLLVADRVNSPPGEVVNFTVQATDACTSQVPVVCTPPSGSFFARGRTLVTCTATDAAGNVTTCSFPVTVAQGLH